MKSNGDDDAASRVPRTRQQDDREAGRQAGRRVCEKGLVGPKEKRVCKENEKGERA